MMFSTISHTGAHWSPPHHVDAGYLNWNEFWTIAEMSHIVSSLKKSIHPVTDIIILLHIQKIIAHKPGLRTPHATPWW